MAINGLTSHINLSIDIYVYIYTLCKYIGKLVLRETGVSRHSWSPIRGPPSTLQYDSAVLQGDFRGPHDAETRRWIALNMILRFEERAFDMTFITP